MGHRWMSSLVCCARGGIAAATKAPIAARKMANTSASSAIRHFRVFRFRAKPRHRVNATNACTRCEPRPYAHSSLSLSTSKRDVDGRARRALAAERKGCASHAFQRTIDCNLSVRRFGVPAHGICQPKRDRLGRQVFPSATSSDERQHPVTLMSLGGCDNSLCLRPVGRTPQFPLD